MSDVFWRHIFAFEYVPQMPITVFANDFDSSTICVAIPGDRTLDLIIEAGPPAMRIKFVSAPVQRRIASSADVGPGGLVVEQFPGAGSFRPLVEKNSFLVGSEAVVLAASISMRVHHNHHQ